MWKWLLFQVSLHAEAKKNNFKMISEPILRLKQMSGKVLIEWKHRLCAELSKRRYMDPDITRSIHTEVANIFFNQEQDDSDEISSEHNSAGKFNYCYY